MIGSHFFGGLPRKGGSPQLGQVLGVIQGVTPAVGPPSTLGQTSTVVDPFKKETKPQVVLKPIDFEEAKKNLKSGKISVRWVAPLIDGSGYAEAARNYVAALSSVGVEVIAKSLSFEESRSDYGMAGRLSQEAVSRVGNYAINVAFMTPDLFPVNRVSGCYNVGLFDWETDVLPLDWVSACNQMDEIWVPCRWTADVSKASGVERPIHIFGHCASTADYVSGSGLSFQEIDSSWYKFYSIFQWTERKNPRGLLLAYLKAFTEKDPVVLILKTYRKNYSDSEQKAVIKEIEKIKTEVGGKNHPRIMALLGMMTKDEMLALHRTGDCFALIQRSEGWGLPHFEACMMGRPVITTGFGATLEFTKPQNSYLIDYKMAHVFGMNSRYYGPHMRWAEPDTLHCSKVMRAVFSNRDEAKRKASLAKSFVDRNFSWEVIGSRIKKRLMEIGNSL